MKFNSRPVNASAPGSSDRRQPRPGRSRPQTTAQSIAASEAGSPQRQPPSGPLEDRRRWEGTAAGLHEDGSEFTARVAMTPRCSRAGMPIGFVVSSRAMDGVRLAVDLHKARTDTQSTLDSVPHAMVIVNAVDEIRPLNVEEDVFSGYIHQGAGWSALEVSEILRGDSGQGAGWSPVEMLIADRYLDRHPGLRMGFFAESQADSKQVERERAIGNRSGAGAWYVCKRLAFDRCCQVIRAMGLIWPLDRSALPHA
jgi:hypothetical protein